MSMDLKFNSKKSKRASPLRTSLAHGSLHSSVGRPLKTNDNNRQQPRASMKRYMKLSKPRRKRMVFDYAKEENLELLSKKSPW
mmetsp:Transcript_3286/g.4981  ORF Transcript_3286/g.4981 Transcript_3286/m.4981 type:complete len:83 (-) Transcript_3286:24-272(-)